MAVRVSHINSNVTTLVNDFDHSFVMKRAIGEVSGVLFSDLVTKPELDLNTSTWEVSIWECVIIGTRTASQPIANQKMMLRVNLYESEIMSLTEWNKIYLEIDDTLLQDQSLIEDSWASTDYALWKTIATLKSTPVYPSHPNYIKLWEITTWPIYTDVRVATRMSDDAIDLPNNTDFQTLETSVNNNTSAISSLTAWATLVVETAGEDLIVSNTWWSVFYWKGEEAVLQETETGTVQFGDTTKEMLRLAVSVANLPTISQIIREISFKIKKIWNPTDKINYRIMKKCAVSSALTAYHSNEITNIEIDVADITGITEYIKRDAGKIACEDYYTEAVYQRNNSLDRWAKELADFIRIEVSRTGAQDAVNCYALWYTGSDVKANYSFESYDGASWNAETGDLCFRLMFWFWEDKIRQSNPKMTETATVDWIIDESISKDTTWNIIIWWQKDSLNVDIWSTYYLNNTIYWPWNRNETYYFINSTVDRPSLYTPFEFTEDATILWIIVSAQVSDLWLGSVCYYIGIYEDNWVSKPTVNLGTKMGMDRRNPQWTNALSGFYFAIPYSVVASTKIWIKENWSHISEDIQNVSTTIWNSSVAWYPVYNTEWWRGALADKSSWIQLIVQAKWGVDTKVSFIPGSTNWLNSPSNFMIWKWVKSDKINILTNEQNAMRSLGVA